MKPTKSITVLAFLSFFFGFSTVADEEFQKKMRAAAAQIPQSIIDHERGTQTIGEIDLVELVARINEVKWELNEWGFFSGSGELRTGAIALIKPSPKVIFNEMSLSYTSEDILPLVALHESMTALGYFDENYERSLGIYLLAPERIEKLGPEYREAILPFFEEIEMRTENPVYPFGPYDNVAGGGGGSSVGSGGGPIELEIKRDVLLEAGDWFERERQEGRLERVTKLAFVKKTFKTYFEMGGVNVFPQENPVEFKKEEDGSLLVRTHFYTWVGLRGLRGDQGRVAEGGSNQAKMKEHRLDILGKIADHLMEASE